LKGIEMILVTHIDLDGIGCEIVTRYFYENIPLDIYRCSYDNVDKVVCELLKNTQEHIIISDISVNAETASFIANKHSKRIEIYDHHKTALLHLKKYSWVVIDTQKSGTKILFDVLCKRKAEIKPTCALKKFVFHVNNYDLWFHESPDSARLNNMLTLLGHDIFAKLMLDRIKSNQELISEHDKYYLKGLETTKLSYFAEVTKRAVVIDNRLVVIATRYLSELSQYIRDISPRPPEWEGVENIDILNFDGGTHVLRSYKADFDVSEVALSKGGGGHPSASGCKMSDIVQSLSWLSQL